MANDVTVSGTIQGVTQQGGPVGPIALLFSMLAQKYASEVKDFPIPTTAVLGSTPATIALPAIPAPNTQSLFLMKASRKVNFTLNADAVRVYTMNPGGVFMMSPGFAVTSIQVGNLDGASEATLYVLQVVGP